MTLGTAGNIEDEGYKSLLTIATELSGAWKSRPLRTTVVLEYNSILKLKRLLICEAGRSKSLPSLTFSTKLVVSP
jgi:hypothetical protein